MNTKETEMLYTTVHITRIGNPQTEHIIENIGRIIVNNVDIWLPTNYEIKRPIHIVMFRETKIKISSSVNLENKVCWKNLEIQ